MSIRFEISGAKLSQKLPDLQKNLIQYMIPRDLDGIFKLGKQEAERRAPFRTGALRGSGVIRNTGPLSRELEFTMDYAAITNAKHPTNAGWFDTAVDYIKQTLPTNIERSVNEQTALALRK